tara:strand:- start:138 stop:389 length:252 start_codon:yes stop_codon:yes gene_type:complete
MAYVGGKSKKPKTTTKRKGQPWMKTQAEVIRLIIKKEGGNISWKDGVKKLKPYVKKAIGKEYKKGGDITWGDAINKTKAMLSR